MRRTDFIGIGDANPPICLDLAWTGGEVRPDGRTSDGHDVWRGWFSDDT